MHSDLASLGEDIARLVLKRLFNGPLDTLMIYCLIIKVKEMRKLLFVSLLNIMINMLL